MNHLILIIHFILITIICDVLLSVILVVKMVYGHMSARSCRVYTQIPTVHHFHNKDNSVSSPPYHSELRLSTTGYARKHLGRKVTHSISKFLVSPQNHGGSTGQNTYEKEIRVVCFQW